MRVTVAVSIEVGLLRRVVLRALLVVEMHEGRERFEPIDDREATSTTREAGFEFAATETEPLLVPLSMSCVGASVLGLRRQRLVALPDACPLDPLFLRESGHARSSLARQWPTGSANWSLTVNRAGDLLCSGHCFKLEERTTVARHWCASARSRRRVVWC